MKYITDDLRIDSIKAVTSPVVICEEIAITEKAAEKIRAEGKSAADDIKEKANAEAEKLENKGFLIFNKMYVYIYNN